MKRLQTPLWLSMVLLSTALVANAQTRPAAIGDSAPGASGRQRGPEASSCRPPGPPMKELTATLGLQANQRDALAALLKERHEAMRKVREQGRQNAKAVVSQSDAKIAKLLSPEQMDKFQQWESSHRPPPPPPRRDLEASGMQDGGPRDNKGGPGGDCPAPPPRDGRQAGGRP